MTVALSFMHWFQNYLGGGLIYHCHIHSGFGRCWAFISGFFLFSIEITLLPSVWALASNCSNTGNRLVLICVIICYANAACSCFHLSLSLFQQ